MSEPIRYIKESVWCFDIEYVPCVDTGRRFLGLPDDMSDEDVVKAMYEYAGATEQDPQPMMKSVFYRVVSIAAIIRNVKYEEGGPRVELNIWSSPKPEEEFDEAALIGKFLRSVGSRSPQLVGFASNMFDLTILYQRAIILGLQVKDFCTRPFKPWDDAPDYFSKMNDYNVDLANVVGGLRWLNPKLSEVALACKIPAKIGMDGSEVAPAWLAGRGRDIVNYNEIDALTTYLLWLKVITTCGLVETGQALEEALNMMEIVKDSLEAKPHLAEFYWQWHEFNGLEPEVPRPVVDEAETINEKVDQKKKEKNKTK